MRILKILIFFLFATVTNSQNTKVVDWLEMNLITIKDSNINSELTEFKANAPSKFKNAKVFGFGESSHHSKEFFLLKIKFFKYLVKNHGVRTLILEESYPSEDRINDWLNGNQDNITSIVKSLSIVPWHCKEIADLFLWIKDYNQSKPKEDQISYYGMDIQNIVGLDQKIENFIHQYNISLSEEQLVIIQKCAQRKINYYASNKWADKNIPELKKIKAQILKNKSIPQKKLYKGLRALNYLIAYTFYIQHHYSQDRDLKMFENVKWIIENEVANKKVFIWAHDEHINKRGFANYSSRGIFNLGRHLKEEFEDDYYSMGFDFAQGDVKGFIVDKKNNASWNNFEIKKPFPKTFAETFNQVKKDIYFIDINKALNSEASSYFKKKRKKVVLGAGGYNPKRNNLYDKKLSSMFDGLIFVKKISPPTYSF